MLAEIGKTALTGAGLPVKHRQGMGGTVILWEALRHNGVVAYPEYTGTIATEILKAPEATSLAVLSEKLKPLGAGITGDLGFNDGYTLVMRRDRAQALGISKISDLQGHPELKAGLTPEFLGRKDGWQPMLRAYGLGFESVRAVEHGLGYAALQSGEIDLKDCYTTDSRIGVLDLVPLADDRAFFPQYRAVYLYRLDAPPKAIEALRTLNGTLTETKMIELNRLAEDTRNYAAAAAKYYGADVNPADSGSLLSWFVPIPRLALQHLTLVAISLAAAIIVSVPLGVIAARPGTLSALILGGVGVLQTIPSLALLAFMIPLFGIGAIPAIAALLLYSLLPIVRGTATGLQTSQASLRKAAEALGLTGRTRLTLIDLPLASPSIMAGIKTSAVVNVGTATLAGLIGGGGFGEPIQSGLQLNDNATILQGAIPAAVLALGVQALFAVFDLLIIPKGLRLGTR